MGRVLLTGSDPDREQLDWIESRLTPALRERVMPITDLTLPQLVAGLSLVDSFVSSSTGPLHIAAIVSRSALGLYSDAFYLHPRRWGPIGPRGSVLIAPWTYPEPPLIRSPLAEQHMAQITVEQVVDRMLANGVAPLRRRNADRRPNSRPAMNLKRIRRIAVIRNRTSATWSARCRHSKRCGKDCPTPTSRRSSARNRLRCWTGIPTSTTCCWTISKTRPSN